MARITYGDIITNIQGSIGGVTFQQNYSGKIARLKSPKRRYSSALQAQRIVATRQLISIWKNMSLENQELWNAYAETYQLINRLGNYVQVTGFNWFISHNWLKLTFDEDYDEAPTGYVLPSVPSPFTFTIGEGQAYISLDVTDTDTYTLFMIYANYVSNQSNVNTNKGFRYLAAWSGASKTTFDINDAYSNAFGINLASGEWQPSNRIAIYLRPYQVNSCVMRGKVQQIFQLG